MQAVVIMPVRAEDSVPGSPDVTITLRNGLSDRDVSVPPGGIVRFVNRDDERHRMRSQSSEEFDTGDLEPGESFQVRLSTSGTYTYIDEREDDDTRYHGRIRVAASGGNGGGGTSVGGGVADGGGNASGVTPGGGNGGTGTASGGNGGTGTAGGGAPPAAATVTIGDRIFQPATTTVAAGGTVTFRNDDGDEHTATSAGPGGIDSGTLATGATYRKQFTTPGSYAFLCAFHSDMRGTIEVVAPGGADPAPAQPPAAPAPTPTPVTSPPPAAPADPGPAAASHVSAEIVDFAFAPARIQVEAGGAVTWTNTGVAPHTATAGDGSFDSKTLESGGTFTQTFATPGTVTYLCQIHPDMRGTIEVIAAPAGATGQGAEPATTAAEPTSGPGPDPGPLGGIVLAVTLVSVAVALFARVVAGTARRVEE